jgi:hypothetical protein
LGVIILDNICPLKKEQKEIVFVNFCLHPSTFFPSLLYFFLKLFPVPTGGRVVDFLDSLEGKYTDDTQMTIALADSLVESKGVS